MHNISHTCIPNVDKGSMKIRQHTLYSGKFNKLGNKQIGYPEAYVLLIKKLFQLVKNSFSKYTNYIQDSEDIRKV